MRKLVAALAALTALLVGLVASSEVANAEGLVDLSSTVTESITQVSPVGGAVVYKVEFSNLGATTVLANLSDSTTNGSYKSSGSSIPGGCTAPANGTANPTITCNNVSMVAGQTVTLYVNIQAPTSATTISNTSNAVLSPLEPLTVIDLNPGNNSDTETTPVFNDPNSTTTYLCGGCSATYKTHTITVRSSSTGVIVDLRDAPAAGRTCGTTSFCADGLRVNFPFNDVYSSPDIEANLNFGKGDTCRSVTNPSCTDKLFASDASGGVTYEVPACTSPASAPPSPAKCVRSQIKLADAQLHIIVGMTSDDPDLLPQGLNVLG